MKNIFFKSQSKVILFFILAFILLILFIAIPLLFLNQAEVEENLSKSELLQRAYEETKIENSCFGAMSIINSCEKSFGYFNDEFQFDYRNLSADDWDNPEIRENDCLDSAVDQAPKEFCEVGDIDSNEYILLQGDSLAAQYIPAFDYLGKDLGVKIVVSSVAGSTCSYKNFVPDPNNASCNLFFEETKNLWEGASLIIFSGNLAVDEDGTIDSDFFIEQMKNNINQISQSGKKIVLFQNPPVIFSEENGCTKDNICENVCISEMDCQQSLEDSLPLMNLFYDFLDRNFLSNQVEYLKVEEVFCGISNNSSDNSTNNISGDLSTCHSQIGGTPVYAEIVTEGGYSHVNSLYATSLGPFFINWYQNRS